MFLWMQGSDGAPLPKQFIKDLLAEDSSRQMASLAKQARGDNDLASA